MKKLTACLTLVGITLTLIYAVETPPAPKLSKAAHWEAYEAALKKGLPKTAITHLDPIIEKREGEIEQLRNQLFKNSQG